MWGDISMQQISHLCEIALRILRKWKAAPVTLSTSAYPDFKPFNGGSRDFLVSNKINDCVC
jgi:hypothetical protein